MKKFIKCFLLVFVLLLSLASCNANNGAEPDHMPDKPGSNELVIETNQKIIYTVNYSLVCEDVGETIKDINQEAIRIEGYISNSNQTDSDYGRFVYKIPTSKLNEFLDFVDGMGGNSSKTVSTQDVTSSYNEYMATIETLEASRAAYVKLLNDSTLTMKEIIEIKDKIDSLDSMIKEAHKNLDSLENKLNYSTVTIEYHKKGNEFNEFMKDYGSFIMTIGKTLGTIVLYGLPFAATAGIIFGIVVIIKKKKKKSE